MRAPDTTLKRRKRGRPRKPGPKPGKKLDGRRKKEQRVLSGKDCNALLDARAYASSLNKPLNARLHIHPCYLDDYPEIELNLWFGDLRRRLAGWFQKAKGKSIGWFCIWVRENYEGPRREHIHLCVHLPGKPGCLLWKKLKNDICGWYAASPQFLKIDEVKRSRLYRGDGVTYTLKQRDGRIGYIEQTSPPTRLLPQRRSRYDGAPVAPVLGRRCGISVSLDRRRKNRVPVETPQEAKGGRTDGN